MVNKEYRRAWIGFILPRIGKNDTLYSTGEISSEAWKVSQKISQSVSQWVSQSFIQLA